MSTQKASKKRNCAYCIDKFFNFLKLFFHNKIFFILVLLLLFAAISFHSTKQVLLSFDTEVGVGDEEAVIGILAILEKYNASSTFFVMGSFAEKNPEIIGLIKEKGHEIACHTQNHVNLYKVDKQEIEQEISECRKSINESNPGFRAPWRLMNKDAFESLENNNYSYDASYFKYQPKFNFFPEIRTTSPIIDDYIGLKFLHLPKFFYFFKSKHYFDKTVSLSYHPHNIIEESENFDEMIKYYSQRKVKFLTHKELLDK